MDRVVKMVGFNRERYPELTGRGVYVGVLDSGVVNHPDLAGRIVAFKDFTKKSGYKNDRDVIYDDNGHGTHV